jgi:UDP-glucose 4-epimerase
VDVNGINKIAGEMYHLLYSQVYGVSTTSLRLTNTYGPRMRVKDARQTFLGIWIHRIIEKQPIAVFGDGLQVRDFTYVDDAVEAFLLAATTPETVGKALNLGSDERITLKDLAALLVHCHGAGEFDIVPFPADRKAIDIGDYYADDSRFRAITGWKPAISLKDGLKRTLDYYQEELPNYA